MDHLLESEYRLTPGPLWLFRVGSDGIAHHITSLIARPDKDYVVVTTGSLPSDLPGLVPCSLECEGAHAFAWLYRVRYRPTSLHDSAK